ESLFFFSSRRRHTRWPRDWSSDVCSSDLNPFRTEWRQTLFDIAGEVWIIPWTAGVVNAHRIVYLDLAGHRFRWREIDLAKRNANVRMNLGGDVNLFRVRKVVAAVVGRGLCVFRAGVTNPGYNGIFRRNHIFVERALRLPHSSNHGKRCACPTTANKNTRFIKQKAMRGNHI